MLKKRPRLRTVLLMVNLVILILPLGSIAALRLYETELVRQTESTLLAQGAVLSLIYRDRLLAASGKVSATSEPDLKADSDPDGLSPLLPHLDLVREHLRNPVTEARLPATPPDSRALSAGQALTPLLQEAQNSSLAGLRLVDKNGTVVASSGTEAGLSLAHREEVIRALRGETTSLLYERASPGSTDPDPLIRRTRYRVHVAIPVSSQGRVLGAVILMRTPLDVSKALYNHRQALMVGTLVLVVVVVLVSLLTSLTINRPITILIRRIEALSRGDRQRIGPLERPGTLEIDRLSRAFADMTERLAERAAYIQAFVSNVSHAFKTPLASTRAAVELLKDHLDQMSIEERGRFLSIIEQDADRLERLVKRLTDLARADMTQARGLSAPVGEVLDDLETRWEANGLTIKTEMETPAGAAPQTISVAMDRETLDSILSNLLDNARVHGGPGVEIRIVARLVETATGSNVELTVTDSGPGISVANREKVFRPFFTTARDRGGTGLGLSIIQALLKAHQGTISLEPSDSGASFRLRLPAAREDG